MKNGKQISFDDYTETYKDEVQNSISFIGQDVDFFVELKADLLLALAEKNFEDINAIKVLDVGSGLGLVDKFLLKKIPHLHGVDVEPGVVMKAKENNPQVHYQKYDGMHLPYEDNTFDLTFAINVMHHVPPIKWQSFINEMKRVLKPKGIIAIFEHNPLNPLTQLVVKRCEFDRNAVLLSHKKIKNLLKKTELKTINNAYIVFFPFKAKLFRYVEKFLRWLPLGAQHFVIARK